MVSNKFLCAVHSLTLSLLVRSLAPFLSVTFSRTLSLSPFRSRSLSSSLLALATYVHISLFLSLCLSLHPSALCSFFFPYQAEWNPLESAWHSHSLSSLCLSVSTPSLSLWMDHLGCSCTHHSTPISCQDQLCSTREHLPSHLDFCSSSWHLKCLTLNWRLWSTVPVKCSKSGRHFFVKQDTTLLEQTACPWDLLSSALTSEALILRKPRVFVRRLRCPALTGAARLGLAHSAPVLLTLQTFQTFLRSWRVCRVEQRTLLVAFGYTSCDTATWAVPSSKPEMRSFSN